MAMADTCGGSATGIHQIQGNGAHSTLAGQLVTVEGIVTHTTGDKGGFNGFYLQQADSESDCEPATSEALVIYSRRKATPGHRLRIAGADKGFDELTVLVSVRSLNVCGQAPMPEPIEVSLPWSQPPAS